MPMRSNQSPKTLFKYSKFINAHIKIGSEVVMSGTYVLDSGETTITLSIAESIVIQIIEQDQSLDWNELNFAEYHKFLGTI